MIKEIFVIHSVQTHMEGTETLDEQMNSSAKNEIYKMFLLTKM